MVYSSPHKKRPQPGEPAPWGGNFDETDYPRGSIKRIMMEDFMTYKNAMVYPGPRLNLVLGPNGSGKSSIVCAVGLALCATSKRLGRADSVKEFVRKGTDKAHLELIVSGGPDASDYRICRTLHSEGNKSTFKINGQPKTQKDVEALNKKLNIQLDNLCQFLPQEKVVEFSKMSPEELLVNTERAIGDAHLAQMHSKLINGGMELRDMHAAKENIDRQLQKKEADCEQMQADVEKITKYDKLRAKAQRLRARVAQLREQHEAGVCRQRKETYKQASAEVSKLEKQLEKAQKPRKIKQAQLKNLKSQDEGLKADIKRIKEYIRQYQDESDDTDEQVKDLTGRISTCDEEEVRRKQDLEMKRTQHRTALDEHDALPEHPQGLDPAEEAAVSQKRAGAHETLMQLGMDKGTLQNEAGLLDPHRRNAERQLARLQEVGYRRLQLLDQFNRGIRDFTKHVEDMKKAGRFKGSVHGPIGTEVRMLDGAPPHAAAALENCVPKRVWSAFVVEHSEDQALLRDGHGRIANVIAFSGNALAPLPRPAGAQETHGAYGTIASLDATFECPAIVKHVLAEESAITGAFLIGSDSVVDRVFESTPVRILFGPQRVHRKTVSRYNSAGVSMTTYVLPHAQLLGESLDQAKVQALQQEIAKYTGQEQQLRARVLEIEQQEQQVQAERKEAEKRLQTIQNMKSAHSKARRKAKTKLTTLENHISKLEKQDPLLKKPALERELQKLRTLTQDKLRAVVSKEMVKLLASTKKHAVVVAHIAHLQDELHMMEQSATANQQELQDRRAQIAGLKADANQAEVRLQAARKMWEEQLAALKPGDIEQLESLPADEGACDEAADDADTAAARIAIGDRGVIERYQVLKRAIDTQRTQQATQAAALVTLQDELAAAKEHWLPQLKEMVAKVSAAFSENFSRIASVGEVRLHEDGDNYEKYAVHIMVKFRDEGSVERLSAECHSGGEKSVSTIMYLLSLQRITDTPFRVVDEINQGMDQTNERVVFQAMVDAATQRGTAQCLLMTPKLLPQLRYSEHVNVLSIVNGAYIGAAVEKLVPSEQLTQLLGVRSQHASQYRPPTQSAAKRARVV